MSPMFTKTIAISETAYNMVQQQMATCCIFT